MSDSAAIPVDADIDIEIDIDALLRRIAANPAACAKLAEIVRKAQTKQARRFGNSGGPRSGLIPGWSGGQNS